MRLSISKIMVRTFQGGLLMISYRIVHHVPGRIRIHVPAVKGRSIPTLMKLATVPLPGGIQDIRPNPWTGNIVIEYAPGQIDILSCIQEFAARKEVVAILGG